MIKKYGVFDMNSNGLYTFKFNDEEITSNDFSLFLDFLDNNIQKDIYILVNDNLDAITLKFQENELKANEDYKIIFKNKNLKKGLTYNSAKSKHVYFRNYGFFFGGKILKDIFESVEEMDRNVEEFTSLSKMNAFFRHYSLFEIMYADFKKALNWEEDFAYKINDKEFEFLLPNKGGGFNLLNPECKNKIIEVSFSVDFNKYYWWLAENFPMPYGKPIYCDWSKGGCDHILTELVVDITAKVKKGFLPIITRSEITFDYTAPSNYLEEINNEIIHVTGEKLERIFKHYDIEYCEIMGHMCFEHKIGLAKSFNNKWIPIENKTVNPTLKKEIKKIMNTFIGMQVNGKQSKYVRHLFKKVDKDNNIETKSYEINKLDRPYIPLYLFITDYGRNVITDIAQKYKKYFVTSKTDSITFQKLSLEKFDFEISDYKLGKVKLQNKENFYYYKNSGTYISANDINKKNGIILYKHSGSKGLDIKNKSFMDVVNEWTPKKKDNKENVNSPKKVV